PDYRPAFDASVLTLFVTNRNRLYNEYNVYEADIFVALNDIITRPEVMGTVINLSSLDTMTNTNIVYDAYFFWDDFPENPYIANNVGLVVQDVISDALRSYPNTEHIVIIGDDRIVPFMRVPDKTAVGNELAYRDVSGAAPTTAAFGALDGRFYLTDNCYADLDPLAWPGGQLCVPDYTVGRLVEAPDEIATVINVYAEADGYLDFHGDGALVTGYDFLTDMSDLISDTLAATWPVAPLINDTWTAVELTQAWISGTYPLQSVNAHFDHFRAIPADKSAGVLSVDQIAGSAWSGAVLGFSVGCHSGFSAHDTHFDATKSLDFAQAMAARGASWIGNTGFGIGDASGVSYSEDLAARLAGQLDGAAANLGMALTQAKQEYIGQAAPGSFDVYDIKVLMQTTLYGLPHWRFSVGRSAVDRIEREDREIAQMETRDITLTLTYDWEAGFNGDVLHVTVDAVDDSAGLLTTPQDVAVEQQISFGRPQLPSLRMDVAQGMGTQSPRGVIILGGQAGDHTFDPIITRVVTDHVYDTTEPGYDFEQWFPSPPVQINRLGGRFGDGANEGQLGLYPAQFRATGDGLGLLRAFEEIKLRVYYDPGTTDWQAPVLRRVEADPTLNTVDIRIEATDAGSGVQEIRLLYSLDGSVWDVHTLTTPDSGSAHDGVWSWSVPLSGALPGDLSFVVQAIDHAGNVAYSSNKGESYRGADSTLYLPLLLKDG
ncbi:MAG: hypothetical protein PVF45_05020, partial [Anaerolineae bacterium]